MRIMFPIAATTLTLAAALATFTPVQAAEVTTKSVRVSYADLDLATAEGAKTLDKRIGKAIYQVCGLAGTDIHSRASWAACAKDARAGAKPQVELAMLKAQREAFADATLSISRR